MLYRSVSAHVDLVIALNLPLPFFTETASWSDSILRFLFADDNSSNLLLNADDTSGDSGSKRISQVRSLYMLESTAQTAVLPTSEIHWAHTQTTYLDVNFVNEEECIKIYFLLHCNIICRTFSNQHLILAHSRSKRWKKECYHIDILGVAYTNEGKLINRDRACNP